MRFYNREKELELLGRIDSLSDSEAQMTVLIGRRRIGKTSLLRHFIADKPAVYLFLAKKSETLICVELIEEIKQSLGVEFYGEFKQFKDLFRFLLDLSKKQHFTLILDEFQEFTYINPAVYSEMQNYWDAVKNESKMNLILCGSVYSLMKKIFENSKEPLFGRATNRIHLKPFTINTLKEILSDNFPVFTNDDLLAFYLFTGGVAKYVELLVSRKAFTLNDILNEIFSENSILLDEGKNILIDEFGKEYSTYFSVLTLIASSKTSRSDIESVLEISVGGYLERLENDFGLIRKVRPVFSKQGTRSIKYTINDNFLNFWFRFIYKYRSAIEIENFDYVRTIVERDYATYSGVILEKYFIEKMISSQQYSSLGTYWEKANQNEIDIVAINEMEKKAVFVEVKRKTENINLTILKEKSTKLVQSLTGYEFNYKGLSIDDM
jgi:hypothetical protein